MSCIVLTCYKCLTILFASEHYKVAANINSCHSYMEKSGDSKKCFQTPLVYGAVRSQTPAVWLKEKKGGRQGGKQEGEEEGGKRKGRKWN